MLAALFVETNGIYFGHAHIDPWDKKRDARTYRGAAPVIAHPPCERWGKFADGPPKNKGAYVPGDDQGCFESALANLKRCGGVLEHPKDSKAWAHFNILKPTRGGWRHLGNGLYTCQVEQGHYGHPARKATWLLAQSTNGKAPPDLIWGPAPQRLPPKRLAARGYVSARRCGIVANLSAQQRQRTPKPFMQALENIVREITAPSAPLALTRPALRWHGGKWKLAPWILQHFPSHQVYVEPFGGAASVLLRKPRAYAEVYNDLDSSVVNLFRVLREPNKAERLRQLLYLTPFSREEFFEAYTGAQDDVEAARQLVCISFMGFGSGAHNTSNVTGFRANSNRSGTTPAQDWANYPQALPAIVERLRGVVVENRDALQVMTANDAPTTLHYVDPPYLWETRSDRSAKRAYAFEMDDEAHKALLTHLKGLQGMVVLSGYANPIYDEYLTDWRRVDCKAYADGALERTECLWLNKAACRGLAQLDLFEAVA